MTPDQIRAANEFAGWLESVHPDIYEVLYAQARQSRGLSGLGDDGEDPVLQEIPFDPNADLPVQSVNVATQSPDDTSSGWGSGILSALSSIGSWMVSPQGLTTLANVGTTVLKAQTAQTEANLKMAVIQANATRAAAGQRVIPITYTQNADGQTVPVYDTGTMQMMPPELESAIQQGRAHPVTLPDGSAGYAIDAPTLTSLLHSTGIPVYGWVILAVLIFAAIR